MNRGDRHAVLHCGRPRARGSHLLSARGHALHLAPRGNHACSRTERGIPAREATHLQWLEAFAGLQKAPQVWKLKSPFSPELQLTLAADAAAAGAAAAALVAATSSAVVPFFFFFFGEDSFGGSGPAANDGVAAAAAAGALAAAALALAQNAQALHLQNCGGEAAVSAGRQRDEEGTGRGRHRSR